MVVKVQVMDLEHQQVENQGDLAEVQVLQLVEMKLEEQELRVRVMLVEWVLLLQATMTMVVVAAEKQLLEEIHQEVLEVLVELLRVCTKQHKKQVDS